MDEAVGAIDRRAGEDAGRLGLAPFVGGDDLIDNHRQLGPLRTGVRRRRRLAPLGNGPSMRLSDWRPHNVRSLLQHPFQKLKRVAQSRVVLQQRLDLAHGVQTPWYGRGRRSAARFPAASAG